MIPAYYGIEEAQDMLGRIREEGQLQTHVRTLSDERVTFVQQDPEPLLPPTEEDEEGPTVGETAPDEHEQGQTPDSEAASPDSS